MINDAETARLEKRILILAPLHDDVPSVESILADSGMSVDTCHDAESLVAAAGRGAGAVLVGEAALSDAVLAVLAAFVVQQPSWSDLPILVLTDGERLPDQGDTAVRVEPLGNVTLLEQPAGSATLLSALRSALRGRKRQYHVREGNRRKDEFLASLSHELRNPLAPIRTSMHILKRMYPAASGVTQLREVVERQVNHLTRLVDDLLDVARITSGKVELQCSRVSLATVVANVQEIVAPQIESSGHRFEVTLPRERIMLDADVVRLVQSLANVIANGIKYTPSPGKISFDSALEGGDIVFRIRDTGVGMQASMLTAIFDMFAQIPGGAGRSSGGLGIGLSLARQFTEMHGGTIVAHSDGPGRGSEFVLRLPVVSTPDDSLDEGYHRRLEDRGIEARNRQVVVVDDNRDGADMLHRLFEADGFTVLTAYDGLEAVEAVSKSQPDIVVMDIGMPGMDGYEAVRRIRQQPGGKDILMIALTGWGQEETKRLAQEAGFDHHMVKPVDFDVLKEFLDQHTVDRMRG
jgi:signal transduction histidine kinase/ActR/RegA family two-component response regulator